jgi:hypothetical protein
VLGSGQDRDYRLLVKTIRVAVPALLFCQVAVLATAQPLAYTIADQEYSDTPAKAQVVMHIVAKGRITRPSLDELLNRVYREAATRSSKYHGRVTHVAVFAYETEAHAKAGMAQWLGMISRIGLAATPKLEIREDRLATLGVPKETRFGLSENQRKEAWKEKVLAQDSANRAAMAKYPDAPPNSSRGEAAAAFRRQEEHRRSLVKAAEASIVKRYKISMDQLLKISAEAHEKNWALPR